MSDLLNTTCLACQNNLSAVRLRDRYRDLQTAYSKELTISQSLNHDLAKTQAMARNDIRALEDENIALKSQLAEARKNAPQWVTYDGTIETLPAVERLLLIGMENGQDIRSGYAVLDGDGMMFWEPFDRCDIWPVNKGDRWAYLPEEVKK